MSEQVMGKVEVTDAALNVIITLNGLTGDITAGGAGKDGDIVLRDEAGVDRVRIDGRLGIVSITQGHAVRISWSGAAGRVRAGGDGLDGGLVLIDSSGKTTVHLNAAGIDPTTHQPEPPLPGQTIGLSGATGRIAAGGNNLYGRIDLNDAAGSTVVQLDASGGGVLVGGHGMTGGLRLFSKMTDQVVLKATAHLDGDKGALTLGGTGTNGAITIRAANEAQRFLVDGATGDLRVGGNGADGDVAVFPSSAGKLDDVAFSSVHLDGKNRRVSLRDHTKAEVVQLDAPSATLRLGTSTGPAGGLIIRNGEEVLKFDGSAATLYVGAFSGQPGTLIIRDGKLHPTLQFSGDSGDLVLGSNGKAGRVTVQDGGNNTTVILDGEAGDIILANADCAEDFDIAESEPVDEGTVMVLGADGALKQSRRPCDRRVAGVISGAGNVKPGIVLDRRPGIGRRAPLALVGKVYCKVDAEYSAIEVGDLLTTSATPGHAMRAPGPLEAFGAVIGKALAPLAVGQGLIPIIVALQ
jgi:hypothetical protein